MNNLLLLSLRITIGSITFAIMLIVGAYWYSARHKKWFHLFVRQILGGKGLLLLFTISIYIMVAYKVDNLKVPVDLPCGVATTVTEIMYVVAGGYISGYIIYLLSVLAPKAIRQKSILSICKNRLWYAKGEIECRICWENTKNKYSVSEFLKKGSHWDNEKAVFTISHNNVKYILEFLDYVSTTLNTIMAQADYLDHSDLNNICKMTNNITKVSEWLKDTEGNTSYYYPKSLEELAECISATYDSFTKLYFKLEQLV